MNRTEFNQYLTILKENFEKRSSDLTVQQEDIWFEKVKKWSVGKWRKTVDQLVEKCERYPVLAHILNVGSNIADEYSFLESVGCNKCSGTGVIIAQDSYSQCCFRCPDCSIGVEKVSLSIPQFNISHVRAGFEEVGSIAKKENKDLSFSMYDEEEGKVYDSI